jgi:DNA-binding GntR family transcriptional regulator
MGEILESQLIHLQYLRKKFIIESNRAVKSIDEHNDIVRSLVAGQASKAEKLLKNHALTLVDKIQESINS